MNVCVRCGEPIDESEPGLRYYGPVTAHEPHRCIEVLRAKIAMLTASPDTQQEPREGLSDADIDGMWVCHSLTARAERGNARTAAVARDFARAIEQAIAAKWGIALN